MPILQANEYPEVRALIDTNLTSDDLPDDIIAMGVYQGEAEDLVVRWDPDAASRTGDELLKVKRAICCLIAAELILTQPEKYAARIEASVSVTQFYRSPRQRADELKGRAQTIINDLLDSDATDDVYLPKAFTLANA